MEKHLPGRHNQLNHAGQDAIEKDLEERAQIAGIVIKDLRNKGFFVTQQSRGAIGRLIPYTVHKPGAFIAGLDLHDRPGINEVAYKLRDIRPIYPPNSALIRLGMEDVAQSLYKAGVAAYGYNQSALLNNISIEATFGNQLHDAGALGEYDKPGWRLRITDLEDGLVLDPATALDYFYKQIFPSKTPSRMLRAEHLKQMEEFNNIIFQNGRFSTVDVFFRQFKIPLLAFYNNALGISAQGTLKYIVQPPMLPITPASITEFRENKKDE